MHKFTRKGTAVSAALLLALTACGDNGDDADTSTDEDTATETEATDEEAAEAGFFDDETDEDDEAPEESPSVEDRIAEYEKTAEVIDVEAADFLDGFMVEEGRVEPFEITADMIADVTTEVEQPDLDFDPHYITAHTHVTFVDGAFEHLDPDLYQIYAFTCDYEEEDHLAAVSSQLKRIVDDLNGIQLPTTRAEEDEFDWDDLPDNSELDYPFPSSNQWTVYTETDACDSDHWHD
ncbi:hypothetical protein [Nesterenkonia populi]|uniref:hypothetical protein n=1 Tax=Nesterenkonia populi TaxID=1591087 RepID=UPI0011BFD112|nr:hypothetical protein [Nesterenkonia populi]